MKRLFVVGLGPGGRDGMTLEAKKALEQSEVICGYTAYADLIREDYPEKEYLVSGMTKEVERCHMAFGSAGRKNDGNDLQRGCRRVRNGRACTVVGRKVSGDGGCDRCGRDSGAFRGSSAGRTADERFCRDFPV